MLSLHPSNGTMALRNSSLHLIVFVSAYALSDRLSEQLQAILSSSWYNYQHMSGSPATAFTAPGKYYGGGGDDG